MTRVEIAVIGFAGTTWNNTWVNFMNYMRVVTHGYITPGEVTRVLREEWHAELNRYPDHGLTFENDHDATIFLLRFS
jgi:hypothetical protein